MNKFVSIKEGTFQDLIVALKEDGVSFDALSDKITLSNWLNLNTRVENILLNDATAINLSDIQNGTNEDDYLIFGDEGVDVVTISVISTKYNSATKINILKYENKIRFVNSFNIDKREVA